MNRLFIVAGKKIFLLVLALTVCLAGLLFWHYHKGEQPINPSPVFENTGWKLRFVYAPWFSVFEQVNTDKWRSCAYESVCIQLGFAPAGQFSQYFDLVKSEQSQGDPDARIIDIPSGKQAYLNSIMSAEGVFTARAVVLWADNNALDIEISGSTTGVGDESGFYEQLYATRQMILNNLTEIE